MRPEIAEQLNQLTPVHLGALALMQIGIICLVSGLWMQSRRPTIIGFYLALIGFAGVFVCTLLGI